jgi:hypothetical protein
MKKYLLAFVAIAIVSSAQAYSGGNGEPNTPYQIANVTDLLQFAADVNNYDKCFILTANIDLAAYTFTAAVIAPYILDSEGYYLGAPFTGIFDGAGHKITNLTINTNGYGSAYLGLFGYLNSGEVKNIGVENFSITSDSGIDSSGGLVGFNGSGSINDCCSTGIITGGNGSGALGGLVGYNSGGPITNSNSMVNVTCGNRSHGLGGLAGSNDGTISHCFATGNVSGYNDEYKLDVGDLGGLVGGNVGTISDSWASGNISGGDSYIGYLGGLAGSNIGGTIINCFATGNVTGIGNSSGNCIQIGGLVGENGYYDGPGTIINCFATGDVNGNDYSYSNGGLVGYNSQWCIISNSYSIGTVTGESFIGGLVGENAGTVGNCYSTGTVFGGSYLGGFAGENYGGTITNCYSTGIVPVNGGGLVAHNYYGTITVSFWDVNTSGLTFSDGGTGKTTAEMKTESTFTDAGWDFVGETANGTDDIWRMCVDNVNYPLLWWQFNKADFTCPDGVDFADFAKLAEWWNHTDCADNNDCDKTDMDLSGAVDIYDLKLFCDNWLLGH